MFANLLPHRIIGAVVLRQRFARFAQANGLVYFGQMKWDDDHDPIRGFTANAGQVDNYAMHGTIHGRSVTVLERTVTHDTTPHGKDRRHSHTWLLASVTHETPHSPSVLLLSHEHARLHDEAIAIRRTSSEHVPVEYRIDAKFLVYSKPDDAADFREHATDELVSHLVARAGYDYEIDAERVYVYSHNADASEADLNQLLSTAMAIADAYDGDIQKSPSEGSSSVQ